MLKLAVLLLLTALHLDVGYGQPQLIKEPNVLTPPYFNIATGKKIESTATCGEVEPHVFCKLTGGPNEYGYNGNLYQGQFCDECDMQNPTKSHPIKYAIDGTEKWWQSPPLSQGSEYNKINITIHLGQVFHVAYAIIKFANSPRAGTWVLERSSDHGKTFQPWQYFANSDSDCHNLFGIDAFEEITSDDSVMCTSEYSDVVPLERGEVIVSIINRRPGAKNFSHSPVLQEWSKATDVRLRLLRTKTLLGHLMAVQRQDPTVTRRYFYSIKDISIGGRCVCNGHADTCLPDPDDRYKLKCECRHNTCGDSCEYCCPGFVQKEWKAAVPESANQCERCNCHGHSTECDFDEQVAIRRQSLDLDGNYEGGGVCKNCLHNTAGINCEKCADGFYRPANVDPRHPEGCRPCDCDSAFTVGTCEPVTGRCYCKPKYAGDRCDKCAPGYHMFPECELCPCFYNGTRDGICLPENDICPCKYNFAGKYCSECAAGFYNFPDCTPCTCLGQGAISDICDPYSGQCTCDEGFGGLYCDQCAAGYYKYPLCQTCACYTAFTTSDICDPDTGKCFCTELVTGESCNRCLPGYYDFPQCKECECSSPGSASTMCDQESGKCQCKPNFQGPKCEQCAPEYYNYPNCIPCDCDVQGSQRTTCDVVTGQCTCFRYIGGRRCDQCAPDYFNFPRCEDCKCDPRGIKSVVPGVCLAFTTGQCDCKENVVGKYCNECSPLHYNLTLGCVDCNCFLQGTLDGVAACDTEFGDCWCKPYTCTQRCSQCDDGFFGLEESHYFGCTGCQCDAGGAMTEDCDTVDGQCRCKEGVTGRKCDSVAEGYYYPTLLQHRFEVEDGKTTEDQILRFGFNREHFPAFSMKGYGEFSLVQPKAVLDLTITQNSLYKILMYYVNPHSWVLSSTISFVPKTSTDDDSDAEPLCPNCSEQKFIVDFEPSQSPALMTANSVFVLNRGEWNIIIEGEPGLLIDYIVLLPSEYYEPGILQAKITEPCEPTLTQTGKDCLMYTHIPLTGTPQAAAMAFAEQAQHDSPTTAHPTMVLLDGNKKGDNHHTVSMTLNDVDSAGKYVLVLEYASTGDRMKTVDATVTDLAGNTFSDVKFNIYSCEYLFLCRQVALTPLSDVMVFDISVPNIQVDLSVGAGDVVYVSRVHAIPYEKWTMEYVEPKRKCITKEGPEFDECTAWAYPTSATGHKIEVGGGDSVPPTETTGEVDTVLVGGEDNTIEIDMDLDPGRYVFLLHYFNPNHVSFSPNIIISDGGLTHEGTANVTFCPSGDGCRGVVISNNGAVVIDITNRPQTMTIKVPADKAFWLDYILAIPEESYNADQLDLKPVDHSRKFFDECYGVGTEGLIDSATTPTDFCRKAVFSLTMDFNDGALPCDCSGAGTVGGGDVDCEDYGGQCPCKPNVIGRKCDRCMIGFYGFPDCKPCDCDGALCDEINGNCICPPNTVSPSCDQCLPFTHSFHPLAGCVACDCHSQGVENATDLGCSKDDGQCRCRENVEGLRCDKCKAGFFGFPDCSPCVCDTRGSISETCDPASGQCLCKENVEGQQCDRCKMGTFYLNEQNPLGCTKCFCFGATVECSSTRYPMEEIIDMEGWRLLNLKTDTPEIQSDGNTLTVDIYENGGAKEPARTNLYWAAPKAYLNDQIGSYGGVLHFITTSEQGGRGDSTGTFVSVAGDQPAPLTAPNPTVILEGNGMVVGWINRNKQNGESVFLNLTESNFVHQSTGNPVKREEMMMVLSPLSKLRIHATDDPDAAIVRLSDVSMSTTDYDAELGSGPTIPTVEECRCPKGYTGESCQLCDSGHFRENRGPYLGYCAECHCYGHCETCDEHGELIDKKDCLHNTAGENCEKCKDGYIGDATTGDPDACQPCPCPFPSEDGNFAESCEYDEDGDVVCHCQIGYTGEKCDQCALGYFGNPSVIGGDCKQCNCHGNLDFNLVMEICNPISGECKDCLYNTGGKYCERCADGFFGDAKIAKNCTKCPCNECGTLQCDHTYGFCACKPHVIGISCNRCEPGYYNLDSCIGCQDCSCGIGARNNECDTVTGACECAPNVVGLKCDKCAPGHWDYSSMGCKPCNCRNNGDCNPVNGECKCPPGITGPQCDQCKLERHILPPGGLQCESCDTCTHDLLDTIEPMTEKVASASLKLSKVSVGVAAAKRLEDFADRSEDVEDRISETEQHMNDISDDADKLLNAEINDLNDMIMSEEDEEASGLPAPIVDSSSKEQDSYIALKSAVGKTELAVAAMCNKTEALQESIEKTSGRMLRLDANATDINDEIGGFSTDSKDLLEKIPDMFMEEGSAYELEEDASGDNDEYLQKLYDAEMLLTRMKMRVFKPMKKVADAELAQAEELFGLVNINFTLPSEDLDQRVGNVSQDLGDKLTKMKELRAHLNDAIKTVTEVATLNAANSKALTAGRDAINRITVEFEEINQIIGDAQNVLNGGGIDEPGVLDSDALLEAIDQLQPVYDAYVVGLEGMEELVNMSIEKANMLKNDADMLSQLVEETKNDPRNVRAVEAANRYQNIINVMENAREAADKADLDATEARDDVAEKNLGKAADEANVASGKLLNEVQDILNTKIGDLQNDLNAAKKSSQEMDSLAKDLSKRMEAVKDGATTLDHGDIDAKIQKTKEDAAAASDIADDALRAAQQLQDKIDQAPDPNIPLNQELTDVQDILADLPDQIADMNAQVEELNRRAARIALLPKDLALDEKIGEIRKKIELSRSRADSVKVSMQFKHVPLAAADAKPEYAQVHIPPQSFDLSDNIKIEMYVNISKSPDNSLLYLGDASTASGDYIALETIGGKVHYYYKVGSGVGEIIGTHPAINDETWHRIVIERNGNDASLEVFYPNPIEGRGDLFNSGAITSKVQTGKTDAAEIESSLPRETTPFVVGGLPPMPLPGKIQNNQMTGCIEGVKVNDESVGLWNFVSYNGPKPGQTCAGEGRKSPLSVSTSNRYWRFRGVDSYIRASETQLRQLNSYADTTGISFVSFKFLTKQHDGLLLFVGQSVDQFFALEIRDGKLHLSCNFGWDEPKEGVSTDTYPDVSTIAQAFNVKIGIVNVGRNVKMIALVLNTELSINMTFTDWSPNIQGDVWFGGIHRNDIKQEFSQYVKNINTNYRGCIRDLSFHRRYTFNIYEAYERIGVTPGCDGDDIPPIDAKDEGFISIADNYPNVENMEGLAREPEPTPLAATVVPDIVPPDEGVEEPVVETEEVRPPRTFDIEDARLIYVPDDPDEAVLKSDGKLDDTDTGLMDKNADVSSKEIGNLDDSMINSEKPVANDKPNEKVSIDILKETVVVDPPLEDPKLKIKEENVEIVLEEETGMGDEVIDIKEVDIEMENSKEVVGETLKNENEQVGSNADIESDDTETADEPISVEDDVPGELKAEAYGDPKEEAQNFAEDDVASSSVVPAILIIIGVIVGVVLFAAVVSAVMKGGLFAGGAGSVPANPPPPPMEQAPLNDVQAQRVAQMDW
ncbi:laminin subunit alpha-5-like isoform X2 [Styela clava]